MQARSRSLREEERLTDAVLVMLVERMGGGSEWDESDASDASDATPAAETGHTHKPPPLYPRSKEDLEADAEAYSAALRHEGATRRVRAQVLGEKRKLAMYKQVLEREARETAVLHDRQVARFLQRRARLHPPADDWSVASVTSDIEDGVGTVQRTLNSWRQMFNRIYADPNTAGDDSDKSGDNDTSGEKDHGQVDEDEEDLKKLRFRLHRRLHSVVDPQLMTSEEQRIHAFIQQTIDDTRANGDSNLLEGRRHTLPGNSPVTGRVYINDAGAQLSTRMGVNVSDISQYLQRLHATRLRTGEASPDTTTTRCMLRLLDLRPHVLPPIHASSRTPRHHVTTSITSSHPEKSASLAESLLNVRFCRYTRLPPQRDVYLSLK